MDRIYDAIYLRKSRADVEAEQHGEGETLARHERALTELAASRGYNVSHIYREVVTADTIADRPQVQALLRDVEAGRWRAVLVMDADRLARGDTIDQGTIAQAFKYSRTLIVTPYKTYDPDNEMDEEFFEFGLFMARREYKMIKRRLQAGRLASVKEGKYMGTRPPYGYERVKLKGQKGWTLEVVPDQAELVREIFDRFVNRGQNPSQIARACDAKGARTMFGHRFDNSYVRTILRDPAYAGFVQWNQRVSATRMVEGRRVTERVKSATHVLVKGLHQPIIDEDTFNRAGELLTKNRTRPVRNDFALQNPLAGLCVCGRCGRFMRRKNGYHGQDDILQCPNPYCDQHGTMLPVVEQAVLHIIREWLAVYSDDRPLPEAVPANTGADTAEELGQLRHQLTSLQKQRERLYDLLEQEIYTTEVFVERSRALAARISATESRISALQTRPAVSHADAIRALLPQLGHILSAYGETDSPQARHDLLASAISRITYDKDRQCYRNDEPGAYLHLSLTPITDIVE